MQKLSIILLSMVLVLVVGCSSTKHMDNYIQAIKLSESNSRYQNEIQGIVYQSEEPLKSVLAKCTAEAFSGKSFKFGSQVISDPKVLKQIYIDDMTYKMNSARKLAADNDGYAAVKHEAFSNAKEDHEQLKALIQVMGLRSECIKNKGWVYYRQPRS